MTTSDIISYRLCNQQITVPKFTRPEEIVGWLGAMQAQEFAMAKWAIGLRLPGSTDAVIEKAFNEGAILRTHLLRPTWHFVTPADIRWMLQLTAPRVHAVNAYWYRKFELDHKLFKRCNTILVNMLQGGKQLTRTVLRSALEQRKIIADGLRLSYIMMQAELNGIICSGPRQGKQFTYALLDEKVLPTKTFTREEALAELTNRYFTSRGPATIQDFAWWSGLTMKEAKEGIALQTAFIHEAIEGQDYLLALTTLKIKKVVQATFLMPDYDEYGISYKNRSALFDAKKGWPGKSGNPVFNHMIVIDGLIAGTWRRAAKNNEVETSSFTALTKTKQQSVTHAVQRYRLFFENEPRNKKAGKNDSIRIKD